jgi:hypothetical protein
MPGSSLTATGRGGLPQGLEVSLPALYLADHDAEPMASGDTGQVLRPTTQVATLKFTARCD